MSHLLQLLLVLTIMVTASKLAGAASKRIGQPSVFGELLVGLLLGPTVLDLLGWRVFDHEAVFHTIKDMAEIGVILLMFLAGFETDLKEMKKVGNSAFVGALGGVMLPLIAGTAVSMAFGFSFAESIFIGTILTATSVSISAQTLIELGQMRSKEGTTILGAAVIDDVMGIIVLSFVVALTAKSGGSTSIPLLLLQMLLYFVVAIALSRFFPALLKKASKLQGNEVMLATAIILCLSYSFFAEYLGHVAAITGAYIAGVIIGQTDFKKEILHKLEVITYSFFVPVFFVSIGLEANARELGTNMLFTVLIVPIAIVTKVVGSGVGVRLTGFNPKESLRVGTGMISRGEVALITSSIGLANKVITKDIFSIMIIMTLITTLITPILLRAVFPKRIVKDID